MKLFFTLVILFFFHGCSFDNKTGIWNNSNINKNKDNDFLKDFKKISSADASFNKIIPADKKLKLILSEPTTNNKWNDIFFNKNNNSKNFSYLSNNQLLIKSKKLSKYKINNYLLIEDGNLIVSDVKGNIIVFSIAENRIIHKYNFYKKRYKKLKKFLNLIIEKDIIYVSDNLGYFYALNYRNNSIIWAKNFNIPFRSNLKLNDDKIFTVDHQNNLYFLKKEDGSKLNTIPTEESKLNNNFQNNLALNNDSLYFLNTYGSLYSIDTQSGRIKWFRNINQSLDVNANNLFIGNEIVFHNKKIIASSNNHTYVIDAINGSILLKNNFSLKIKPILTDDILFLITKNDFLVAIDLVKNKILYSYDINEEIADYFDIKKKKVKILNFALINNNIFIFLKNSYVLIFGNNGELQDIYKLKNKINSNPIFINNSILYLNKSNKLIILN